MDIEYYAEEFTRLSGKAIRASLTGDGQFPRPLAFLVVVIIKFFWLFRIKFPAIQAQTAGDHDLPIEFDELPPPTRADWAPVLEQLIDLQFELIEYVKRDFIGDTECYQGNWLSSDRRTVAVATWQRAFSNPKHPEKILEFHSYSDKDPEFTTVGTHPKGLLLLKEVMPEFVAYTAHPFNARLAFERHCQTIRHKSLFVDNNGSLIEVHKQRCRRRFDWAVETGLLRKVTAKEYAKLKAFVPPEISQVESEQRS